jgi:hypothetical protein
MEAFLQGYSGKVMLVTGEIPQTARFRFCLPRDKRPSSIQRSSSIKI